MEFSKGVKFIGIGIVIGLGLVVAFNIFKGNNTAQASADAPYVPPIERQMNAYATMAAFQLKNYNDAHAAIDSAAWGDFGRNFLQLVFIVLGIGTVLTIGWFVIEIIPVMVDTIHKRRSVVRASNMDFLLVWENDELVAKPLDKMADRRENKIIPVVHDDKQHVIEVDGETGEVTDVYGDFTNFLERAVIVSENDGETRVLPTHKEMNVSGSVWDRMVNEIGAGLFKKAQARKGDAVVMQTFCAEPYTNIRQMYIAACRHKLPLPQEGGRKK